MVSNAILAGWDAFAGLTALHTLTIRECIRADVALVAVATKIPTLRTVHVFQIVMESQLLSRLRESLITRGLPVARSSLLTAAH